MPLLSRRSAKGVKTVTFTGNDLVINATFGGSLDAAGVVAFTIKVDNASRVLGLRTFRQEELDGLEPGYAQRNNIVYLRPNGINKNRGRRITITHLLETVPWLAIEARDPSDDARRRFPVFEPDLHMYILQRENAEAAS